MRPWSLVAGALLLLAALAVLALLLMDLGRRLAVLSAMPLAALRSILKTSEKTVQVRPGKAPDSTASNLTSR